MMMYRLLMIASCSGALACLPEETRDTPGELLVAIRPFDAESTRGFRTADGWDVEFEKFLVVVGGIELKGDACESYTEPSYSRALDATHDAPQKVSLSYALGACDVAFEIRPPTWDTVLGAGVTAKDELLLRTADSDAYTSEPVGTSLHVQGHATRGSSEKTFRWSFHRFINQRDCRNLQAADGEVSLRLRSAQQRRIDLRLHTTALFRTHVDPSAALRFEPFAAADEQYGNADHAITLDELRSAPLPEPISVQEPAAELRTLGDWVYLGLLPRIVEYPLGTCTVTSDDQPRDGDGPF